MRLDHLLSKEHTASVRSDLSSGVPGSSYVDHWLFGVTITSRPRCTSQLTSSERAGPAPAPPETPCTSGVHCSVLRKRSSRPSLLGRTGASLPLSSSSGALPTAHRSLETSIVSARTLENCIASTSVLEMTCRSSRPRTQFSSRAKSTRSVRFQATKSQRWMPWRQMPMKDVGGCEKPRGAVYQALIRGSSEWGNPAGVMPSHPCLNT